MQLRRIALCALLSAVLSVSARADFLGSGSLSTSDTLGLSVTQFQLGFAVGQTLEAGPYLVTPLIGAGGGTYTFDLNSPNFAATAAALINGVDDGVELVILVNNDIYSSVWDYESVLFPASPRFNTVDFDGETVRRIVIDIDPVTIQNSDQQTYISYNASFSLYDSLVPAPGSTALGLIGFSWILRRRRTN